MTLGLRYLCRQKSMMMKGASLIQDQSITLLKERLVLTSFQLNPQTIKTTMTTNLTRVMCRLYPETKEVKFKIPIRI